MKATGIVRKIDELGRIVLPKELRKNLNINPGDDFQIFLDSEKIILEKYYKMDNFNDKIDKILKIFSNNFNMTIFVVKGSVLLPNNSKISSALNNIILERKGVYFEENSNFSITNELKLKMKSYILPIVDNSDILGCLISTGNISKNELELITKTMSELIKYEIKM